MFYSLRSRVEANRLFRPLRGVVGRPWPFCPALPCAFLLPRASPHLAAPRHSDRSSQGRHHWPLWLQERPWTSGSRGTKETALILQPHCLLLGT